MTVRRLLEARTETQLGYRRPWIVRLLAALLPEAAHPAARRFRRAAGTAVRRWWYRGGSFECPCCQGSFRRMLNFNNRLNVQCPACLSLERHRHLCVFLERFPDLGGSHAEVLHLAPEASVKRFVSRRAARYVTADLEDPDVDVRADLCDLPFERESFDLIICSQVLEHVEDEAAALAEIRRILRTGGHALILVPVNHRRDSALEIPTSTAEERARLFGQWDHVREYGRDFPEHLQAAGFDVEIVDLVRELPRETVERFRLQHVGRWGPDEIFVATKAQRL